MSEFVQAIREASDMSLAGKTVTKVTLSEGHLSVTVAHCSVSVPSLVIDAGATTVGKGTTLRLTVGGKAAFS